MRTRSKAGGLKIAARTAQKGYEADLMRVEQSIDVQNEVQPNAANGPISIKSAVSVNSFRVIADTLQ